MASNKHQLLTALLLWLMAVTALLPCASAQGNGSDESHSLTAMSSEQLLEQGRHHFEQRQPGKALLCFTTICERYDEQMDSVSKQICIRAMNNRACVYKYYYYDYPQAYEYFTQAYELCEREGFDDFLPVIMVNLGDLLSDYNATTDNHELKPAAEARQLFRQCMERAVSNGNWELMTTAFFNLSNQNYDLDLSQYNVILSPDIPANTPDLQYVRLQYEGIARVQQGDYAGARHCFMQQLAAVSTQWAPERDTIATYLSIAHTYELEGDFDSTLKYLNLAQQKCDEHNIYDTATVIGDMLSRLNAQMALRQRYQQYALLAGAIILLLLVSLAAVLWYKNRQLTARNRSLYEKNQQLLRAEEEERQLRKAIEEEKYRHSNLSEEQRDDLTYRLQDVLSNAELTCQQDFTLARLAKLVDSNTTYVSQVINEKYGATFSTVLGSHRVREACRRMTDHEHYGNLTIEAISASVGFKSRTAFLNAFKRETGLTPSEYLRQAAEQKA